MFSMQERISGSKCICDLELLVCLTPLSGPCVLVERVYTMQEKEGVVARGQDREGVQGLSPPHAHSFLKDPAVIYTHTRSRRLSESLCGREGEEGGKRARGKERGSSKYSER